MMTSKKTSTVVVGDAHRPEKSMWGYMVRRKT